VVKISRMLAHALSSITRIIRRVTEYRRSYFTFVQSLADRGSDSDSSFGQACHVSSVVSHGSTQDGLKCFWYLYLMPQASLNHPFFFGLEEYK
jgi:hypothetical protein